MQCLTRTHGVTFMAVMWAESLVIPARGTSHFVLVASSAGNVLQRTGCRIVSLQNARVFCKAKNRSLKCGIAGSINFWKCRVSVRASQRARGRNLFLATRCGTSAKFRAAHTYIREFSKGNSKLNKRRYFSGSFKPCFFDSLSSLKLSLHIVMT